jgi:hypothetical protein
MTKLYKQSGEVFNAILKKYRITSGQAARAMGVSEHTVNSYRNGQRSIPEDRLEDFVKMFSEKLSTEEIARLKEAYGYDGPEVHLLIRETKLDAPYVADDGWRILQSMLSEDDIEMVKTFEEELICKQIAELTGLSLKEAKDVVQYGYDHLENPGEMQRRQMLGFLLSRAKGIRQHYVAVHDPATGECQGIYLVSGTPFEE